jgi:hypothetical protein
VAHLVGVDVPDPGGGRGFVQVGGDVVPGAWFAVFSWQQKRIAGCDIAAAVVLDEPDEVRIREAKATGLRNLPVAASPRTPPGSKPSWSPSI